MRNRLTYANVISTLCLFLLLGGATALAASKLAKNSVGTSQLKSGAVTAAKVKSGSLLASNFAAGQLPAGPQGAKGEEGKEGREGEPGQRGLPGERGVQGERGESGTTNVVTRYGPERTIPTSAESDSYAACETGESVTGGGFDFPKGSPSGSNYYMEADRPSVEMGAPTPYYPPPPDGTRPTGWEVAFTNATGSPFTFRSYVVCASP